MTRWTTRDVVLALVVLLTACGQAPVVPAAIDTRHDACRFCRMTVSDLRFAAQIVAPGDEPLAFDDLGCLRDYLRGGGTMRAEAVVFVADHLTREWVRADSAVFTRVDTLATPMSSHVIAHRDKASRDRDPDARGGAAVSAREIVPAAGGPTP